jgi:hypoxanthine phosphoribosyltransferase
MHGDIERVLISKEQIAHRVAELARQITDDHLRDGGGSEMAIVAVMTGAMVFCGDLIRHIPVPMKIGLMTVSNYPGSSLKAVGAKVLHHRLSDVNGRNVLLLDDILDSGGTIKLVVPMLRELGAVSVRTCVLLRKDRPTARVVTADYVGFDIPDEFVVGYGLDYNDYYRNLPDIVTLKPQVYGAVPAK